MPAVQEMIEVGNCADLSLDAAGKPFVFARLWQTRLDHVFHILGEFPPRPFGGAADERPLR